MPSKNAKTSRKMVTKMREGKKNKGGVCTCLGQQIYQAWLTRSAVLHGTRLGANKGLERKLLHRIVHGEKRNKKEKAALRKARRQRREMKNAEQIAKDHARREKEYKKEKNKIKYNMNKYRSFGAQLRHNDRMAQNIYSTCVKKHKNHRSLSMYSIPESPDMFNMIAVINEMITKMPPRVHEALRDTKQRIEDLQRINTEISMERQKVTKIVRHFKKKSSKTLRPLVSKSAGLAHMRSAKAFVKNAFPDYVARIIWDYTSAVAVYTMGGAMNIGRALSVDRREEWRKKRDETVILARVEERMKKKEAEEKWLVIEAKTQWEQNIYQVQEEFKRKFRKNPMFLFKSKETMRLFNENRAEKIFKQRGAMGAVLMDVRIRKRILEERLSSEDNRRMVRLSQQKSRERRQNF